MTNENDPAFTGPTDKGYTPGLTKLEYFAAMAMQGLLSHPKFNIETDLVAEESVTQAKALITELNKEA